MTKKKEEKNDYKKVAEELARENAQLNESLLRERADAMNVRKRAEEERTKLAGYFKAEVIKELLPTIDNLERALKSKEQRAVSRDELHKGIESIYKQFAQTLEKLGIEKVKTVGEHFDPELHEAVTMENSLDSEDGDSLDSEEIVSEELQSGYKMNNQVIRHAMVRVKC